MRAINVLLSILISLAIGLLIFEGGLRLFPAFRPTETINQFDPVLGWSKRPNAEVHRSATDIDITIRTNAEGLRDDQGVDKPDNTFRVLMLGDSFTLGYTVEKEETFADLCERWWKSQGRRVEVINAGTEGYATDQEVLWFLENGASYKPDLVLLFPYDNDIYWCGEEKYTRFPKPRFAPDGTVEKRTLADPGERSIFRKTAIGKFLGGGPKLDDKDLFTLPGSERRVMREFAPMLKEQPNFLNDAIARSKGAMRALKRRCDELGAGLVMVPIPSEMVVHEDQRPPFDAMFGEGAWDPERPLDLFANMAKELGITALDARKDLKLAGQKERLYFDKGEWHFNAAGNLEFARYLVANLDDLGVFPSEHSAIAEGDFGSAGTSSGGGVPTWLKIYAALVLILGTTFWRTYPEESAALAYLKIAGFLALIFTIILGGTRLIGLLPAQYSTFALLLFVIVVLGFVGYKLGRRLGTIAELLKAFTLRGHWYLMPLVVVLLTIGSLLVVAASSPLIAPFIYTLF